MATSSLSRRRAAVTSLEELVLHRRATPHFTAEPVPSEIIETALSIAAQAPSGYNFQPWRFLVLTERARREKLQAAAFGQEKIGEAPVVVVAFAQREGWKQRIDEILETRGARTGRTDPAARAKTKETALQFISTLPPAVWLNRHVMIAFTHLMLAVEALGWDTAPMEGFDPAAVRQALDLPDDSEVIALLAIGRAAEPEPPHPGRLPVSDIAFLNHLGNPLIPFNDSES